MTELDKMNSLPLLNFTSSLFSEDIPKDVYLIGIQHLAFTTVEMINALIGKGLPPSNIFLLGKCYSANPLVINKLKKIGVQISPYSDKFDSHRQYDSLFKELSSLFLQETLKKLPKPSNYKIILLDDGGTLLQLAKNFLPNHYNLIGIEQTSSGFHLAKSISKKLPIINVARSKLKLNLESKFIARMLSRRIINYIKASNSRVDNLLIIGQGYIGRSIATLLKTNYPILTYDLRTCLKGVKKENLSTLLKRSNLIVGCTGFSSISPIDYKHLRPGSTLISGSSSDREFTAAELRKQIPPYYDCHRSPDIHGILLVNSGFPINFDRNYPDSKELQLTRSLILAAIFQAVKIIDTNKTGFIPLWYQDTIRTKHLEIKQFQKKPKLFDNEEFNNQDFKESL